VKWEGARESVQLTVKKTAGTQGDWSKPTIRTLRAKNHRGGDAHCGGTGGGGQKKCSIDQKAHKEGTDRRKDGVPDGGPIRQKREKKKSAAGLLGYR